MSYRSFVMVGLCALVAGQTPGAPELIEKHLNSLGSAAGRASVNSLVRKGVIKQGGAEFAAHLQTVAPDKWRLTFAMEDGTRIEAVSDGKESWEQTPGGTEATPALFFAQLDPAFSLRFLLDPAASLKGMNVKGREQWRGREVWSAEVAGPDGKPVPVQFDAENGCLVRFGSTVLEDYRKVDGIALPHAVGIAEGRMQFMLHAREAALNAPVAAAHFVKESNTAAYRAAQQRVNAEALDRWGQGIDFGAAREVLLNLGDFSPQDGRILYDVITAKGYRRGLEIGTARGNSALWMGLAFKKTGGKLITLEINPDRARVAKENFRKAGLDGVVECRANDAFKEIPLIEGSFDFVFMDTGTPLHQKLFELLRPRLVPGSAVSSHNANDLERLEPAFLKTITTDPDLETKITRTPSGGVSVSIKKR